MNIAALHNKIDNLIRSIDALSHHVQHIEWMLRDTTKKGKPPSTEDNKSQEQQSPKETSQSVALIARNIYPAAQFLAKTLVWAGVIVGLITGLNSLRWDISVDPYVSLDPKDAFATRFLVSNLGPYSIYDVTYECAFYKAYPAEPYEIGLNVVASHNPVLTSHQKFSVRCENPRDGTLAPQGMILEIQVWYKPSFAWFHRSGYSRFAMLRDKQGNAQWIPIDATTKISDLH